MSGMNSTLKFRNDVVFFISLTVFML
jgi:hypothetical protein